jgi:hypothetical protein
MKILMIPFLLVWLGVQAFRAHVIAPLSCLGHGGVDHTDYSSFGGVNGVTCADEMPPPTPVGE